MRNFDIVFSDIASDAIGKLWIQRRTVSAKSFADVVRQMKTSTEGMWIPLFSHKTFRVYKNPSATIEMIICYQ